jgi:chromate reductase
MTTTYNVGFLVGSLAKASINRLLAQALAKLGKDAGLALEELPIRELPLYSYDYDADFPPVAKAFKQSIASVDAILFVTPEYNRSIPGALKNAIDWASRPWGSNSFSRKPTAVIGTSPGAIGTAVAQQHLRSVLCFCNSPLMNTLEAYIQFKPGLITETAGGDGCLHRRIPAQLPAGVPPVHRARADGVAARCDEAAYSPSPNTAWVSRL